MPEVLFALLPALAILVGYAMGRAHSSLLIATYKRAVEEEHKRQLELAVKTGGPCWIKHQIGSASNPL